MHVKRDPIVGCRRSRTAVHSPAQSCGVAHNQGKTHNTKAAQLLDRGSFRFLFGKSSFQWFSEKFPHKARKKIYPQSQKRIFVLKVFLHKVRKKFCSQRLQSGPRSLFSLLLTYMVARFRTKKLAQCLLPILLIQEKPFANFTKCNHSETV